MTNANKRQRERLLELIRRLAEDDKNGVMAQKVLKLFWTLAHSQEIQPDVLDQALAAHVKILDYSCSQERDAQKIVWLDKCVQELKSGDNWVLPALRLIREICCLYDSLPSHAPRTQQTLNRQQVIERLQNDYTLVILVTNSLTTYMDKIRTMIAEMPNVEPNTLCIDGRYPHNMQIQERLDFLKFLLKDGQLWLCAEQVSNKTKTKYKKRFRKVLKFSKIKLKQLDNDFHSSWFYFAVSEFGIGILTGEKAI